MKNLRLLLWEECNRTCPGCCNKDFDLANLPVYNIGDETDHELIMLTGGEPMLKPAKVMYLAAKLRKRTNAKIVMYTAAVSESLKMAVVSESLDGITVTVHEPEDAEDVYMLDETLCMWKDRYPDHFSARLNIFAGAEVDTTRLKFPWIIKDGIEWIVDCPLPVDEEFMRLGA